MNSQPSKVLIIGAGPTGMTAVLELSRLQIPVRIIEKSPEPATTSRAIGVQSRTLELFEQRGLVERMLSHGNRGQFGSIYGQGKRTFRLDFSRNGSRYGYMLFISQAETEAILRGALEQQQVTIEREVEFVALSQSDRGGSVKAAEASRRGRSFTPNFALCHLRRPPIAVANSMSQPSISYPTAFYITNRLFGAKLFSMVLRP